MSIASVALWLERIPELSAQARAAGTGWLSEPERARLDAIVAPRRRTEFVAGRWLARRLLAASHGGDPRADWPLSAPAWGPPRLLARASAHPPHVALSHSGNWVVAAVASAPIGLDIEAPARERNLDALAAQVCTARERSWLEAMEAGNLRAAFYGLWTLKEAWLKRAELGATPDRLVQVEACEDPDGRGPGRLWLGAGMALALVAPRASSLCWHGDASGLSAVAPVRWCVDGPARGPTASTDAEVCPPGRRLGPDAMLRRRPAARRRVP